MTLQRKPNAGNPNHLWSTISWEIDWIIQPLFAYFILDLTRAVVFRLFQKTVILPPKPVGFRLTYTQFWDIFFIWFVSICLN